MNAVIKRLRSSSNLILFVEKVNHLLDLVNYTTDVLLPLGDSSTELISAANEVQKMLVEK